MKYLFLPLFLILSSGLFSKTIDESLVNQKLSFWYNFKGFGYCRFVSLDDFRENNEAPDMYLIDSNNTVLYQLPAHYGSARWSYGGVYRISSLDMNFDGSNDITVIAFFIAPHKPEAFTMTSVYLFTNGIFTNFKELDSAVNSNIYRQDISKVYLYMKNSLKINK